MRWSTPPAIRAATSCGSCTNGRKPQIVMPVHGEALHLVAQARSRAAAASPKVLRCATAIWCGWRPAAAEVIDKCRSAASIDGRLIVADEQMGVGERRRLAFAGHVAVAIVLDDSGDVLADPDRVARRPAEADAGGEALQRIVDARPSTSALESIPEPRRRMSSLVQEAVRRAVRARGGRAWGKKPAVIVHRPSTSAT